MPRQDKADLIEQMLSAERLRLAAEGATDPAIVKSVDVSPEIGSAPHSSSSFSSSPPPQKDEETGFNVRTLSAEFGWTYQGDVADWLRRELADLQRFRRSSSLPLSPLLAVSPADLVVGGGNEQETSSDGGTQPKDARLGGDPPVPKVSAEECHAGDQRRRDGDDSDLPMVRGTVALSPLLARLEKAAERHEIGMCHHGGNNICGDCDDDTAQLLRDCLSALRAVPETKIDEDNQARIGQLGEGPAPQHAATDGKG